MEDVEDIYELLPMQHGMLFDSVTAGDGGMYLIQLEYLLHGDLRVRALEQAWRDVVARHAVLRTSFHWEGLQKPMQVVHRSADLPLVEEDWSSLAEAERERRAAELLAEDRRRGVDFEAPPLLRLVLVREGPEDYRLLWSFHHILMEGWSASLVLDDVLARYRALTGAGGKGELAAVRPYRDYVAWFQDQDPKRAEAYWRAELAGFESPTHLGIDLQLTDLHAPVTEHAQERIELSEEATAALQSFAKRHGLTLNTVVQGAWAVVLARYAGEEDVVFGAMVSGRSVPLEGVESMVGLFVNLLPSRARVAPGERLVPWLKELQARQARQREFEYCPLVEVKSWSEVQAGLPLFESFLVFENWSGDLTASEWSPGLAVRDVRGHHGTPGLPLMATIVPAPRLEVRLDYDVNRFEADAIARLGANLAVLLGAMVEDPERRLGDLPVLAAAEAALLDGFNETAAAVGDGFVHQRVAARAAEKPDGVAVRCGASALTYGELDARARRLAGALRRLGAAPGTRVAVCVECSADMVAVLLATMKTGAAYVPLDPAYPRARIGYILADAGAAVLVTERALAGELPEHGARVLLLDDDAGADDGTPDAELAGGDLAYVIYTSGSTGKPKGVEVGHAALVNFLDSMAREPGLGADDVLVAVTTLSFDIAGLELYLPLIEGAELVVATREEASDGEKLIALLRASGATVLQATPATWRLLIQSGWTGNAGLKALCGGEALPPELAEELRPLCGELWNMYGPTETTIWSTTGRVELGAPLTVGKPIGNTQVHVLDDRLHRVPVGVTGELYIGGDGLARGYSARPALTAERFVPDPFRDSPGARMYRTGDLARYRTDGTLEILGRVDHQVKLRGFRIELGEIEVSLARHDAVDETVVVAREDAPGDKRLVAYVVASEERFPGAGELRAFLKEGLPDYMVPATFVRLDALPRTPNGKIDRRGLPAPEGARPEHERGFVAPRTEVETQIADVWQAVLNLERVGVRDNFFDLGGHSLLLMPVIGDLKKKLGVKLSPGDLVMPTLGQLAALCEEKLGGAPAEAPVEVAGAEPRLEPFYFGSSLFGCLHRPATPAGDTGVVLCYPLGHEYIQFHRPFRQLALLLAEAGFPALRFDFHGCGDSAGDEEGWRVERWVDDVRAAAGELRARAGVSKVVLMGTRLGGTLAALAGGDAEALVLWDPVLSGSAYVEELRGLHKSMEGYAHVTPRWNGGPEEILGFALPAALRTDLATVDLLALDRPPAPRVLVIESNESVAQAPLRARLASLGADVELQRFSNPHLWVWIEDFGKVHVPRQVLEAVVDWIAEREGVKGAGG